MSDEQQVEQKVVSAVGTIVVSEHGTQVAQYIEKAVSTAILKAMSDGVPLTDTEEIKRRMNAAHAQARKELGLD